MSNAVRVMNNISSHLTAEKSTALFFPKHVPWYDFLFSHISEKLHRKNSSNKLDIIDVSEKIINSPDDAGRIISQRYCPEIERWPGESYAEFLSSRDDISLNNTYVWIKGINKSNYKHWCSFADEYETFCSSKKNRATFILEYFEDGEKTVPVCRNIHIICWENEIKSYDYYMFCSLLVSDLKCSDEVKHYIAELAFLLGERHAEFCALLTEYKEKFAENPEEILRKCAEKFRYSDGEEIQLTSLYLTEQIVLEAQIKNIFPIIERYRRRFITDNYEQLDFILPIENKVNEKISEPYDLDIGNIKYLIQMGKLKIDSEKEKKELDLFYRSRNKIAHNNAVSYQEVKKILSCFSESK